MGGCIIDGGNRWEEVSWMVVISGREYYGWL